MPAGVPVMPIDAAVELNFNFQPPVVAGNPPPAVPVRIEDIVTRPDLADRAILLTLAPIPESGTTTQTGACALAGVRVRTTAHPGRAPRRGRAWVTDAAAGAPP